MQERAPEEFGRLRCISRRADALEKGRTPSGEKIFIIIVLPPFHYSLTPLNFQLRFHGNENEDLVDRTGINGQRGQTLMKKLDEEKWSTALGANARGVWRLQRYFGIFGRAESGDPNRVQLEVEIEI